MDASINENPVTRINPGCFNRAGVETEAGEIEVRLSIYGNWMVHIRPVGEESWKVACTGDMESGVLVTEPLSPNQDELIFGPLKIHRAARQVFVADEEVALSRKEFDILIVLASDPYRVFTKEELMKAVWGWCSGTRTLDTHTSRLRRKLVAAGVEDLIISIRGIGYRLCNVVPPNPRITRPRRPAVSHLASAS